ncbi:HNH endonuclease [Spirosoma linguale]|uniref:HNH endonuclease n=1 Tax=Spirosoma linguale (strain ATCC 33905 / DSM 74 / LMG 10896 / Claus 1) TaxID=504472 RepID=D2QLF4_SPILD|nr:HNH endonuclease [Spirosoma linguale DSM 74]
MGKIPTVVDFDLALSNLFRQAEREGKRELVVNSGELHRLVGGYPAYQNRITTCCGAMRRVMTAGDRIVHQPPEGNGASLDITYALPRLSLIRHFVAYHKFSEWGPYETGQERFSHYSNRPLTFLEKSKGQRIWVIGGEKNKRQTEYTLLSYFSPDLIESDEEKGFHIEGDGFGFTPPINLSSVQWFSELIKEQHNFSLGINEIKNPNVIQGLLALGSEQEQVLSRDPEKVPFHYPEEVPSTKTYVEGAVKQITVNRYERDQDARTDCINHYGAKCQACEFDFEEIYGNIGKGYIHVHHIKPFNEIKTSYRVDPIKDLIPVCPNCHAMLHTGKEVMDIADLKALIMQLCIPDKVTQAFRSKLTHPACG